MSNFLVEGLNSNLAMARFALISSERTMTMVACKKGRVPALSLSML
jgi:hypothetical protein